MTNAPQTSASTNNGPALVVCWSCKGPVAWGGLFCDTCKAVQPPVPLDHFARLGLKRDFDIKVPVLDQHPDRFAADAPKAKQISQSQAVAVNEAYETLKDPLTRAAYLLDLLGEKVEGEGAHTIADEELLMDQLERREALMEADNPAAVEAIARQAKLDADPALSALASDFASGDKIADKRGYLRLKYLVKLGEEARARRARLSRAR